MATPYRIVLGPKDMGNFHQGAYNPAAAAKVSEVLQLNLENWTIIFSGLRHSKCRRSFPLRSTGNAEADADTGAFQIT